MSGPRLKQYTARVEGVTYSFNGLVELMAKATPLRSGDLQRQPRPLDASGHGWAAACC